MKSFKAENIHNFPFTFSTFLKNFFHLFTYLLWYNSKNHSNTPSSRRLLCQPRKGTRRIQAKATGSFSLISSEINTTAAQIKWNRTEAESLYEMETELETPTTTEKNK